MHCSYLNTKMEFHTGQRNRLNNQHPNFCVYHIINILYIPEARSCTSLTSIFSLLETGPAQLLSYSIKQITWGNTKMVIKHRAEDLDDVYWAQEHTMLFEGVHKVNLEIIKTPGYLNFFQDDADFWFIYFLFMPLPHQYSDSPNSAPCNTFLQVSIAALSTSHIRALSCEHELAYEGPLLHSQIMTFFAPVYELVKENVPSVFTFTPLSLAVPTAFPLLASYFRLAQLISCYPQRVCSCLPNPSYSRLHSLAPCFIFISGSPDCPHSEGTQLTSAPNNNYHPGYLSRKILAVDGEILHLSMCTAPSKTVGHKCS